jgi:hypothetical protein
MRTWSYKKHECISASGLPPICTKQGDMYALSKDRIHQLQNKALNKLKKVSRKHLQSRAGEFDYHLMDMTLSREDETNATPPLAPGPMPCCATPPLASDSCPAPWRPAPASRHAAALVQHDRLPLELHHCLRPASCRRSAQIHGIAAAIIILLHDPVCFGKSSQLLSLSSTHWCTASSPNRDTKCCYDPRSVLLWSTL